MNEREKALRLLERLRLRTEARGATAAEAAQAAELAERIVLRYGLDQGQGQGQPESQRACEVGGRTPQWATILGWAIEKRLACRVKHRRGGGLPRAVVFCGEEHRVRVAQWLFLAIAKDLHRLADDAAAEHQFCGADRTSFKAKFRTTAAWQIHFRMNPPPQLSQADLLRIEQESAKRRARRKRDALYSPVAEAAFYGGIKAGSEIEIGTNAVGSTVCVGRLA